MRKFLLTLFATFLLFGFTFGQLTGPKSIPGDYATIALAIADLNAVGVGGGGVTFNVAAGHTETTTDVILLTATGTVTDPIIFQKSGPGANPLITRTDAGTLTTTTLGAQGDAVIIIQGSDYVTFDGISVATQDQGIEYGYYLRKASGSDACKNVTIKNGTITMTKGTSGYVVGLYSSNNDPTSLVSSATGITVTSTGGRVENLLVIKNNISNVFAGIVLRGFGAVSPYDFYDQNAVIGTAGNGNTIFNYAGNAASASWGVYMIYQTSPTVSYNTIDNAGGGGSAATYTLYGIFMSSSSLGGVFVANNNAITLNQGSTSGAHGIYNAQLCTSITINNNTFGYGTFASTSDSYLIYCSNSTPDITVDGNVTTGTITKSGAGKLYGYYNYGGPSSGTATINNNNFSNIVLTGASEFYGIRQYSTTTQVEVLTNNTISNITAGTSAIYGIYQGYGAANSNVSGNWVFNMSNPNAASTTGVYGIYLGGNSAPVSLTSYGNTVTGLSSAGSGPVYGIYNNLGAATSIYKNKIYNLENTNAGGFVYGIHLAGGATTNVYNNLIGDLRVPNANAAIPLAGINVTGGTTANIFYNTVYLNGTSTGALFGSSAIYASTTPTLDLRNNILVNTSTPVGATGFTAAYRRSGTTLTSYAATSNNNLFYAGIPGANNLIYYDGTNADQTLADYKARVSPRDNASVTENPTFLSTTGSSPNFLHIDPTVPTRIESGATNIAGITDDYDGTIRQGNAGYTGTGTAPDIGADEGEFTKVNLVPPASFVAVPWSSTSNHITFVPTGTPVNNAVIVWNLTGTFTSPSGPPPAVGEAFAGGTLLYNGTTSPVNHTGLTAGILVYYSAWSKTAANDYSEAVAASATPIVPPATAFTATPFSTTQIDLAWIKNGAGHNVVIATNTSATIGDPVNGVVLNVDDPITGGGTVIYNGPLSAFSHTGLTANTTHYYKAWSVDESVVYSTGVTANASTPCDVISTFPWNEGFETGFTDQTAIGGCYTQQFITGTYSWTANNTLTTYNRTPHTGAWNAYLHYSSDTWLFREFHLTAGQSYTFDIFARQDVTSGATLEVKYGTAGNAAGMVNTIIASTGITNGDYQLLTGSFIPDATDDYYIGIHGVETSTPWYVSIDDISLYHTPSCLAPNTLTAANITSDGADLGWSSTATAWEYQVGLAGFTPAETGTATTLNPTPVTGLLANTNYDFYVRSNCGGRAYSPWSGPYTFSTLCNAISTFPYTQSFAATLTDCWFASEGVPGASRHWATTTTDATHGVIGPQAGDYFAYLYVYLAEDTYNPYYLTTLDFNLGATTRQVKYYYWLGADGYQSSPDPLTLQISTDGGLNWTDLYVHNSTNSTFSSTNALTGWTLNTVILANYINQTVTFRFKSMSNYGNGFCNQGIDEFVVEDAPPSGTLQGTVLNPDDEPLFNATVSFDTYSTTTNGAGFYQFTNVPVGAYDVTCSMTGFQPKTVTGVSVTLNNTTTQNFSLAYQLDPPERLKAVVQNQYDAHLTWREPGSTPPDQWIHWDNGSVAWGIGSDVAGNFDAIIRFAVSDIATFDAMHLTKIRFYATSHVPNSWELRIYQGPNPPTLIYSQPLTGVTPSAWNDITLTTPLLIDGTQELWFGYHVDYNADQYPAGCDAGPAAAQKNWLFESGIWNEMGVGFLNYNWNIQGWVTNARGAEMMLTKGVEKTNPGLISLPEIKTIQKSPYHGSIHASGNIFNVSNSHLGDKLPDNEIGMNQVAKPEFIYPDAPLSTWPVEGYNVYRDGSKINTSLVTTLFYDNTGLTPGTYDYTVKAVYSMGESPTAAGPVQVTIYSCAPPTDLHILNADLNTTSAKATWIPSVFTPNPEWVIEYGLKGFTHGTGTVAHVTPTPEYIMTSLSPGMEYDFYVRTFCNQDDSSLWVKKTFRTHYFDCPQGAVAEQEVCGDTTNNGCDLVFPAFEPIDCGVTICGTSWYGGVLYDSDWYTFTLTESKDVTLTGSAEFNFVVGFVASPCPQTNFIDYNVGAAGTTASVTLQLAAGTYYAYVAPTSGPVVCDSINRYYVTMTCSTCLTPTALTATIITMNSAVLGWTSAGSLFNIEWGPTGFTPGTGTPVNGVTNPYTLTQLNGATWYDYYVQTDCGQGVLSFWAGPYSFMTLCDVTPAPWTEGFEGTTFFPICWSGTTVAPWWVRSTACGGYGLSTASAKANFYGYSNGSTFDLITLQFDASSTHLPLLKFDYAYATYSGEMDEMDVYTSTDGGGTYDLLLAMPGGSTGILNTGGDVTSSFVPTPNQWATQSLTLPVGTNMVKFTAISAYGNNLYLDNVRVEATPIPEFLDAQGTVTGTECFNATQTITVGGTAPFIVETGGSATLIAGHNILFMPGTWAKNGSYMLGKITTTGTYCGDAGRTMDQNSRSG
ncbi:MAG: carboxypeptidase regulatory-like domain-containing protein [Bacteroidales bacterium]|nr:carboxypeptidase regulatory-like domain-containing protein [Bacteroidales bacterium]